MSYPSPDGPLQLHLQRHDDEGILAVEEFAGLSVQLLVGTQQTHGLDDEGISMSATRQDTVTQDLIALSNAREGVGGGFCVGVELALRVAVGDVARSGEQVGVDQVANLNLVSSVLDGNDRSVHALLTLRGSCISGDFGLSFRSPFVTSPCCASKAVPPPMTAVGAGPWPLVAVMRLDLRLGALGRLARRGPSAF